MSTPIKWACDICASEYNSIAAADACEARGPAPHTRFKVGDFVTYPRGFGWYDGDRAWIPNADAVDPNREGRPSIHPCPRGDGNCFSPCCTFHFLYVITAIDTRDHLNRFHLGTLAMSRKTGYRFVAAYNLVGTIDEVSPEVREAARELIGQKAGGVL